MFISLNKPLLLATRQKIQPKYMNKDSLLEKRSFASGPVSRGVKGNKRVKRKVVIVLAAGCCAAFELCGMLRRCHCGEKRSSVRLDERPTACTAKGLGAVTQTQNT